MSNHVAGLVKYIKAMTLSPVLGNIGPGPVPALPSSLPGALPGSSSLPYVLVRKISGKELQSLTGLSNLTDTIMQVEVHSKSYDTADSIREQIKSKLCDYVGPAGNGVIAGMVTHLIDIEFYDGARELHQCITRYRIWWERLSLVEAAGLVVVDFPIVPAYILFPVYDIYSTNSSGTVGTTGAVLFPVYDV